MAGVGHALSGPSTRLPAVSPSVTSVMTSTHFINRGGVHRRRKPRDARPSLPQTLASMLSAFCRVDVRCGWMGFGGGWVTQPVETSMMVLRRDRVSSSRLQLLLASLPGPDSGRLRR